MQENQITFDSLPQAIQELLQKVDVLLDLIKNYANSEKQAIDEIMSIDDACEFLQVKKKHIYRLSMRNALPKIKKGRRLYFLKSDLISWLKQSRIESTNKRKYKI